MRAGAGFHAAAMLHDDFLHHGEAKAGTIGLRGVEGAEEFGQVSFRDAGAIIRNDYVLQAAAIATFGNQSFSAQNDAATARS